MSRYPSEWKKAVLRFLLLEKAELHKTLGYKKLSWDPIRNKIMDSYETWQGKVCLDEDMRLTRQNMESWEKGSEISDEKFSLIDKYVREMAISGKSSRAVSLLADQEFIRTAAALSDFYASRQTQSIDMSYFLSSDGRVFYSRVARGTWYRQIVIKTEFSHGAAVKVLVAYLPDMLEALECHDHSDIVFFKGIIVPISLNEEQDGESMTTTTRSLLKLTRPAFRGHAEVGYAEGEISTVQHQHVRGERYIYPRELAIGFVNPIYNPSVGRTGHARNLLNMRRNARLRETAPIPADAEKRKYLGRIRLYENKDLDALFHKVVISNYGEYLL